MFRALIATLLVTTPAVAIASPATQDAQRHDAVNALERGAQLTVREARLERALRRAHDASVVVRPSRGARSSGVNVDSRGMVVAALHNVSDPGVLRVEFRDGRVLRGHVVRTSRKDDLALIALENPLERELPAIALAKTEPTLGALIAAIGSPHKGAGAGAHHVSLGRLRGLPGPHTAAYDAWTYYGHGGAAVVNDAGRLIAVHTSWDPETRLRLGARLGRVRALLNTKGPTPKMRRAHATKLRAAINELEADERWTRREAAIERNLRSVHGATVSLGGGTGVVITPGGLMLTARHVVDHSLKKPMTARFPDGRRARAVVIAHDKTHDLALLRLADPGTTPYPHARLARSEPNIGANVVIVGNPAKASGRKAWHSSTGQILWYGSMVGIRGDLAYNAWTYWGHSGSPVFDTGGRVVGIHNSWNDQNAWRHGLRLSTVRTFVKASLK